MLAINDLKSQGGFVLFDLTIIQGVNVLACSDMWSKITVKDGATLNIDGTTGINDIVIRDALEAIKVEEGGSLFVDGATFTNNHKGVFKELGSGDADFIIVHNSTFEVDNDGCCHL